MKREYKKTTISEYLRSKGYQTCEYITADKGACINTNIIPTLATFSYFKVDFKIYNKITSSVYVGAWNGTNYMGSVFGVEGRNNIGNLIGTNLYTYNVDTGCRILSVPIVSHITNNRMQVSLINGRYYHDSGYESVDISSFINFSRPLFMFAVNSDGGGQMYCGKVDLWEFECGASPDEITNKLIPVYKISSNESGLYDYVKDVFLRNNGGGTITHGNDIVI